MVKLVDAGDSKSPFPRGSVGSIPTSGTIKNKGLAFTANLSFFAHFVDCARNCAHLRLMSQPILNFTDTVKKSPVLIIGFTYESSRKKSVRIED